jgi:hypothetical protein
MLQEFLWFVHEFGLCNYEKCKRKILRHMVLDGIEGQCNKIKFVSTKQLYIRNIYNLSDIFKHAQLKRFIMDFINTTLLAKQGATHMAIPQSDSSSTSASARAYAQDADAPAVAAMEV